MSLLYTVIIGLIVGVIAKMLMPGRDPGSWLITILLGVAGAFVGTLIGRALNLYRDGEVAGFLMSVVGAMLLLFLYRLVTGRTATKPA